MKQVNSTDFQRHFSQHQDAAMAEPIAITKHDRPRLVMMSYEEYKKLRRGFRKVQHVTELSDSEIDAIMQSEMPSGYEHLNEELDD